MKKIGAIDPKIKAEIDWIYDNIDRYWKIGVWEKSWHLYWYNKINELAKRI